MKNNFALIKWAGILFTVILTAIAIDPSIFHVPSSIRPWFFITNIAWLLMIASGIFSS
ncbi:MAG: hypothetical protein JNM55_21305 [Anaerolineales bacterium]|nr:hypothetical protein [Anaerolineales bacterium]